VPHRRHRKAQLAGNGVRPCQEAATRLWRLCGAPFGQVAKRPAALLRPLEVEWLPRRERA